METFVSAPFSFSLFAMVDLLRTISERFLFIVPLMNEKQPYRAYLLRCWREQETWRIQMEMVWGERREKVIFGRIEDLATFLSDQLIEVENRYEIE